VLHIALLLLLLLLGVVGVAAVRVPAYYALILRSLTVLEGLALQADANYKLLGRAYPYIARRLLTDPAPELRASFEDLVIKVRYSSTRQGMCVRAWCDAAYLFFQAG
jgi:predicted unusual protein kinase regulating ubiquinone biosynthesis (AarF/ABC1/UbiB family)